MSRAQTPMTQKEAVREARRRWSNGSFARSGRTYGLHGQPDPIYVVGQSDGPLPGTAIRSVGPYGSGDSFEAAFADADRRAKKEGAE